MRVTIGPSQGHMLEAGVFTPACVWAIVTGSGWAEGFGNTGLNVLFLKQCPGVGDGSEGWKQERHYHSLSGI